MNFAEWLDLCERKLDEAGLSFGHGTACARDEAAWLVLAACGEPVDGSFDRWDEAVAGDRAAAIAALLQRRIGERKPLAYLLGEAWFCGLRFKVDERVLVPRSPLAELIAAQFAPWLRAEGVRSALDLCTGSGCIAVAMAVHLPRVRVDAADISAAALEVTRENRALHRVEGRVELVLSDLYSALAGRRYDLVVANPPYVSAEDWEALPPEYHAEPRSGLVTGLHGLELPLKILLQTPEHLHEDGVLICEVGENAQLLAEALPTLPLTWLEFEHGGDGVLLVGKDTLQAHRVDVETALERLRYVV